MMKEKISWTQIMKRKKTSSLKPKKIVSSFYRALDRENEDQSENDQECAYDRPEDNSPEPKKKKVHPLKKLRDRFQEYLQELPVLGFNSGRYDLNAVEEFQFPVLVQNEGVQFTIKRNHNFVCLKTPDLRFLDGTNFLAPGFSYDKFLKSYECPQTKGFRSLSMAGFSWEIRTPLPSTSRSVLFYVKKQEHFWRRLPVLPTSLVEQ